MCVRVCVCVCACTCAHVCCTGAGADRALRPLGVRPQGLSSSIYGKQRSRPASVPQLQPPQPHLFPRSEGHRCTPTGRGQEKAPALRVEKGLRSGRPLPPDCPGCTCTRRGPHRGCSVAVMAGKVNSWELEGQTEPRRIRQEGWLQKPG